MARILITSGPTRQYLDPVRYLTNASSGRMGSALAAAAAERGHEVIIVSGPVAVAYPAATRVVPVVTTEQMLQACSREFPACDGMIAAAAPCDYQPLQVATDKIAKTGAPLSIELLETPDIVGSLAREKRPGQWVVAFALETGERHRRAVAKLAKKCCDLIAVNGPQAIDAAVNDLEVLDRDGTVVAARAGSKSEVATMLLEAVEARLMGESR